MPLLGLFRSNMNLPILEKDKANHVIYGAIAGIIASTAATLFMYLGGMIIHPHLISASSSISGALLVGLGKEYLDKRSSVLRISQGLKPLHTPDIKDVVYTVHGGIIAAVPLIIASLPHMK
jgi:hypothetical protein